MAGKINETALVRMIMLAVSKAGAVVFRNNQGKAWAGPHVIQATQTMHVTMNKGDVLIRDAFPIKVGLITGAGDLIGYRSEEITQDMVGKKVARFLSLEAKMPKGRVSPEQENFARVVNDAGGLAKVVRSEEDAVKAVKK